MRGTASNAATVAAALRAYFRYRTTCGDPVQGLLGVIASPAHWSLASLPRALKPAEVEQLLASFTAALPSPRRGYAMVRCALDLGLRSGEVARLQLADIDWRAGTVTLKRTKSRRQDILPLPAATGRALADYLRHERPDDHQPAVFVRRLAPRDEPIGVDAVRRVIGDAYRRIGMTHGRTPRAAPHPGVSAARSRQLAQGGGRRAAPPLANTSLIYAKLDSQRWPRWRCRGPGVRHERAARPCRRGSSNTWPSAAAWGSSCAIIGPWP